MDDGGADEHRQNWHRSTLLLQYRLSAASPLAAQDATPFAPVVAQERAVLDAVAKGDTAAFNKALGSDFVYVDLVVLTYTSAGEQTCGGQKAPERRAPHLATVPWDSVTNSP